MKKKKQNLWEENKKRAKKLPPLTKEEKEFCMQEMETTFGKLGIKKSKK